jgi:hypothetical protein
MEKSTNPSAAREPPQRYTRAELIAPYGAKHPNSAPQAIDEAFSRLVVFGAVEAMTIKT